MNLRLLVSIAMMLAFVGACASGGKPAGEKPSGREQMLVEARAVVIGVDQRRRLLALEGDGGERIVLPVAEDFRDFERARVGDHVVVSFTEAIAWQVKRSDQGAPGVSSRETLRNPEANEPPGGTIERALTVTATITAFDIARGTVSLTGPDGLSNTIKVHRPTDLEKIAVGDLVDITYSRALAVGVRPEEKK